MFESSILSGEAIQYRCTGEEEQVLLPILGDYENLAWYPVVNTEWHVDEETDEDQLIGFYVKLPDGRVSGLRRASAVRNGR